MKTPDEIKSGLQHCAIPGADTCVDCPYDDGHVDCAKYKNEDALAYIQQLESRLAQTEREREAAVRDAKLGTTCDTCKHVVNPPSTKPCIDCGTRFPFWEWRGVCPENAKEEK